MLWSIRPSLDQRPRDDRELRIVDPPERDRRQHGRHDERDQHDRADHRLERHVPVQQQRQIKPDREFDGAGDDRVEQRVEHREPEDRIVPQPLVVLEADENAGAADAFVGETHPDAEAQRIGQEQDQERRRRQHEPQRHPVAVGLAAAPTATACRRIGGLYRHRCLKGGHAAPIPNRKPTPGTPIGFRRAPFRFPDKNEPARKTAPAITLSGRCAWRNVPPKPSPS